VAEELVAQLLNAGRWDDAVAIFCNASPFDEVLRTHLARIISYYYLSIHSSEENVMPDVNTTVPDRCKACLGGDLYIASLRSDFARVLSLMTERLDDRTLTPETFLSLNMGLVSSRFSSIALPVLSPKHPEPPPPYFPLQAVVAATVHLGQDIGLQAHQVWTPAVSVFVLRHLFDQANATSDSTVSLSFIRRIAFVASIAADALTENYPLDMAIWSLRNFLERDSTREESTQILKYMLNLGNGYFVAQPHQFSHLLAHILPSTQSTCQTDLGHQLIPWLHMFAKTTLPPRPEIEEINSLLEFIVDPQNSSVDPADIFYSLLQRDPSIWGEEEFLRFVLSFLSDHSDVFTLSLATLEGLLHHFLNVPNLPSSGKSKRWFGLAIGRLAQDRKFEAREYVSRMQKQGEGLSATDLLLLEVAKRLRSDSKIVGLLEQSLRTVASITGAAKLDSQVAGILKYLSSPQVPAAFDLPQLRTIPSPSVVDVWTRLDSNVPSWVQLLASSIAQHSQNQLLNSFLPPISASINFAEAILPLLIDEGRFDAKYGSSLTAIFNSILGSADTVDVGYLKHILEAILAIRERSLTDGRRKIEPLLDELHYLHAASAAVRCSMYKTGLMFLEMARGNEEFSRQLEELAILSTIYRNLDDPDLPYALSGGVQRTWNQLLDVYTLHKDREVINGLYKARLRGKVELGLVVSSRDSDMEAIADSLRLTGFPFKFEDESGDATSTIRSVYKSAWRLGTWEAPPLTISDIPDTLIYSILLDLHHGKSPDSIFSVLHPSITQLVDTFCASSSAPEQTNSALTLSLFSDLTELLSSSGSFSTIARNWKSQILERARFGR
jgi:serine-protein kinase ATM